MQNDKHCYKICKFEKMLRKKEGERWGAEILMSLFVPQNIQILNFSPWNGEKGWNPNTSSHIEVQCLSAFHLTGRWLWVLRPFCVKFACSFCQVLQLPSTAHNNANEINWEHLIATKYKYRGDSYFSPCTMTQPKQHYHLKPLELLYQASSPNTGNKTFQT